MPIEKAPYIKYTEETSVVDYGTTNSEIPVIIAPTKVNVATTSNNTTTITYQDVPIDKDHIYLINSFKEAEALFKQANATEDTELLKHLRQYFTENSYYFADEFGTPYVYVIPVPTGTTGTGDDAVQHPIGSDFTDALELITMKKEVQTIGIIGLTDIASIKTELATELSLESQDGFFRIVYIQAPSLNDNETIINYASRIASLNETLNNPRICLVEPDFFGYHLAKICNTPYYLEVGYLPYYSVDLGVFKDLTKDERDALCMAGLIFGEDDYTLSEVVPRMCLGVSSAFGKVNKNDYKLRTVDALLHARRNVDHQVREIFKIIAPQLKRNETSVTLRYVQDEVMSYLDKELANGTIMEYEFSVEESSYNPYCLLVKGRIVPVNSTLAIEFKNTIGTPYSVATDYI